MTNLLKLLKIRYDRPGLIYGLYMPLEIPIFIDYGK